MFQYVREHVHQYFSIMASDLQQFVSSEKIICKIWNVHFVKELLSFQNLAFSCPNSKNWLLKSKNCDLICAWGCASIFFNNDIRLAAIRFKRKNYLQNLKCTFCKGAFKLSESGLFMAKLQKLTSQEQKACSNMCVSMCINIFQ